MQENLTIEFYDGKDRQIRVILPENYQTSGHKYPVLYMFDGQNLFNPEDSFAGTTWGVREALEKLISEGKAEPMILVGIDHADEMRLTEYSPWNLVFRDCHIEGEGAIFSEFLIRKLIPMLEEKYPIKPGKAGRTLAGSSMGALISSYIALKYPDHFSAFGIFSLCSWVNKDAFTLFLRTQAEYTDAQFFVQVGGREGYDSNTDTHDIQVSQSYLKDSRDFVEDLKELGVPDSHITFKVGEEDWHSESSWKKYMPEFLEWIQNPKAISEEDLAV